MISQVHIVFRCQRGTYQHGVYSESVEGVFKDRNEAERIKDELTKTTSRDDIYYRISCEPIRYLIKD